METAGELQKKMRGDLLMIRKVQLEVCMVKVYQEMKEGPEELVLKL